ncbi:hypothetical protein WMF45_00190 [Sorangium sp. So ce448]|uniref:hypothetical protein n=1 Tax=Sorangium sp. So ce448 TaxID=3133314 RepID=UPI003F60F568
MSGKRKSKAVKAAVGKQRKRDVARATGRTSATAEGEKMHSAGATKRAPAKRARAARSAEGKG